METQTLAARFLDRILDPLASALNREAAQSLLDTSPDSEVQARVAILAGRANEGLLTSEERDEYLSYIEAADMLAILKLKARQRLDADD
ncbi:hypothetical protein [Aquisphaera insulae]|uniref:hypothetical protein n=1 Tax=Aquisphaera insulae TaxID=2712864 RepID=UPI0013EB0916|nr:hypothetical protein [Aquisphaera insulae]